MGKELRCPVVGSPCLNTLHFPAQSFVALQNDASSLIIGYKSIRGNSDHGRTVRMITESAFRLLQPAHMPTSPHPRTPHFHATCPHAHILSPLLYAPHHHSHGLAICRDQLAVIRRARALQNGETSVLWRNFGPEHHGVRRDFLAIKNMCGQLPKYVQNFYIHFLASSPEL
jgi:hypothetical protein